MPWINDPAWSTFASAWHVDANYMMVHEHYLDFSYAPVVHARDLPPGLESMGAFNDVEVTETTVSYTRLLPELPLAGWQADSTGLDPAQSYKHREGGTFVTPAMHRQYWEIEAPDGTGVHHHSDPRHHARSLKLPPTSSCRPRATTQRTAVR